MLHQRGIIEVTPATLRDRLATMESTLTAFDGAFLRLPTTGELITKATAVKASAIAADLQPLYALRPTRFKYNFAVVPMQHDLDVFDDWTVPLANIGALAKVARDAGLVGIVIDNESLVGLRVNYPYDVKFANRTLEDYRAQTQLIGRKIMQAIVTEFPDAAVVVLRGPAGADPASPGTLVNREADSAPAPRSVLHRLRHGQGARARWSSTAAPTTACAPPSSSSPSAAWRKTGLASAATDSAFLTESLRDLWPTSVNVVVRRARARRRPRQPAAQPADGVRQHAGAVAARRRHLRLGVVRPDRPDQGDGDRALRRPRRRRPGRRRRRRPARSPRPRPAPAPACSPSTSR